MNTENVTKKINIYKIRIASIDTLLVDVLEMIHADRNDISALTERAKLNAQRQAYIQFIAELEELL